MHGRAKGLFQLRNEYVSLSNKGGIAVNVAIINLPSNARCDNDRIISAFGFNENTGGACVAVVMLRDRRCNASLLPDIDCHIGKSILAKSGNHMRIGASLCRGNRLI